MSISASPSSISDSPFYFPTRKNSSHVILRMWATPFGRPSSSELCFMSMLWAGVLEVDTKLCLLNISDKSSDTVLLALRSSPIHCISSCLRSDVHHVHNLQQHHDHNQQNHDDDNQEDSCPWGCDCNRLQRNELLSSWCGGLKTLLCILNLGSKQK